MKTKEILIKSIEYKDNQEAKENIVNFILNYILYHNLLERDDACEGKS